MKFILITALLAITFTAALSYSIIPDFALYSIVWTAIGLFIVSQILLFASLIINTDRKTEGNPLSIGIFAALGFYCLFSFLMVFFALLLSGFTVLLLSHLFVVIILFALICGIKGVAARSKQASQKLKAERNAAEDKADILKVLLSQLRGLKRSELLSVQLDKIDFLAERIKQCRGVVPAEIDVELEKELQDFQLLVIGSINTADESDIANKMTDPLTKIETIINRRERYARR